MRNLGSLLVNESNRIIASDLEQPTAEEIIFTKVEGSSLVSLQLFVAVTEEELPIMEKTLKNEGFHETPNPNKIT